MFTVIHTYGGPFILHLSLSKVAMRIIKVLKGSTMYAMTTITNGLIASPAAETVVSMIRLLINDN